MNPYTGVDFFEFIVLFFTRLFALSPIVQDEIQIYTLSLIAISSSVVGAFLVFRKMCMLANSLSHTILTGVVCAFLAHRCFGIIQEEASFSLLMPSEWLVALSALIFAFITVMLTDVCVNYLHVKEDAAIGMVFSFLFAAGIVLVTVMSRDAHIGAELVMGNADLLTRQDLSVSVQVTSVVLFFIALLYRPLLYTTFDPVFSSVLGIGAVRYRYVLMGLLATTVVASFHAVGVLLVIAFLTIPPLIARRYTSKLHLLIVIACVLSVCAVFLSVAFSRHLLSYEGVAASTSSITVLFLFILFLCSLYKS